MSAPFNARAWLGDTVATTSQLERVEQAAGAAAHRWPAADAYDERTAALNGATQIILGDNNLQALTARWLRARRAELEARAAIEGGVYALLAAGEDPDHIARTTGLDRGIIEHVHQHW